jgi:hypothetical protein
MSEFSNLLRQRLGSAKAEVREHPEADVLNAFAEQLLPEAERRNVLAHLSVCWECREIVALSQPEIAAPAAQPVFTPAAVPFWRRLFAPVFGVTAVAAVAIVAIVVLQSPQEPSLPSNQQARVAPAPILPAPSAPAVPPPPSSPAETIQLGQADSFTGEPASTGQTADASLAAKARAAHSAPAVVAGLNSLDRNSMLQKPASPSAQPALTAGLRKQDFLNSAFFDASAGDVVMEGQRGSALPSAPQPRPSSSDARFAANAPAQITIFSDIPANAANSKSNVRIITPPPPPERFGCTVCKVVTAGARTVFRRTPSTAPAITQNSVTFSAMGSGKFSSELQKGQPSEVAAAPEKSEAGALDRTDALTSHSLAGSGFASSGPLMLAWKVAGGKLLKNTGSQWEDAYPAASFQFTAVNSHGSEVWAGGSNASLIHSRDGGATWESSRLGESASGTIVSIILLGNHVEIKTSDDQSWSSSDDGKSWRRN